jgi:serine/threonine-protein kinase HipA
LSPAFDVNPSVDKDGLALNIDMDNNALDFELAKDVGKYFMLNPAQMDETTNLIKKVVGKWQKLASEICISGNEQDLMESAFRF